MNMVVVLIKLSVGSSVTGVQNLKETVLEDGEAVVLSMQLVR